MKNAILVSSDARWRAVTEGTLLSRGWRVASCSGLGETSRIELSQVQAVLLDADSLGAEEVARLMSSKQIGSGIPVMVAPGFRAAENLADFLESPVEDRNAASDVKLRFWGVRGSIPSPGLHTSFYGGNTSCVELKAAGETLILDAGSGIRPLGDALIHESDGSPLNLHLLFSHTHWDHIQGFPFFRPAYQPANRIRLVGYSGVRHDLEAVLNAQMELPYFPVSMSDMMADVEVVQVDETFECGSVKVRAFFTNHPGKCCGFRMMTRSGDVAYVPDNELNKAGLAAHMPREDAKHFRERFLGEIRGARVLIHDSQYTREEYVDRVGWGHSSLEDVVQVAAEAEVERLILFHHDPVRTDEGVNALVAMARALVEANGWKLRVDAAREGLEISL